MIPLAALSGKRIEISCYACTYRAVIEGVILDEVDFLAGAKSKVDAMVARARDDAARKAKRPFAPKPRFIAQLMGHPKVGTTMNVYTQVLDGAARSRNVSFVGRSTHRARRESLHHCPISSR
jgi:hypothetical protein